MKHQKIKPVLHMDEIFSKIVFLFLAILAFYCNMRIFGICMTIIFVFSFVLSFISYRNGCNRAYEYIEKAAAKTDASESMPGFPFPAVSVSEGGKITWYNREMEALFDGELLFQRNITEFIKDFSSEKTGNQDDAALYHVLLKEKRFDVFAQRLTQQDDLDAFIILYFLDATEKEALREKCVNERFVSMLITFDNYEEVMQGTGDNIRSSVQTSVDRILFSSIDEVGGVIKKLERDRYIVVCNASSLDVMMQKKFPILDSVRNVKIGNVIAPTLSIGVGLEGETFLESYEYARAALDMALGRGGDQVVIKDKNTLHYFGGKTREVEKRTKVKARVVAYALRELILQSSNIIITGHKNPDADCVGAAMGIVAIARMLEKRAYILQQDFDDTASAMVNYMQNTAEYKNTFLKRNMLEDFINSKTLLIVVDTNATSYMEDPTLLDMFSQTALIDHHRRSQDYISDTSLAYHEPYASSTSEMITEMLPYLNEKSNLLKVEAEALFAGVYLDTKGFTFKTGVRTLEAAAYLRRAGVDPITVKQFFKNDLQSFTQIASFIKDAAVYHGHIALTITEEERSPSLVAQTADELLNVSGIDTSFVLAQHNGYCIISGRSTGDINVQIILEKLGGGGHFSVAGSQIKEKSSAEIKDMLLVEIEKYLKEE